MKKFLFLPLLTIAALVSQGWAQHKPCTGAYANLFCEFAGPPVSCWNISTGAGTDDQDGCVAEYKNCQASYGKLYTGTASGEPGASKTCASLGLSQFTGDKGFKVIADFENGSGTAFSTYSYGYGFGTGSMTENADNGYYSINYSFSAAPTDNDGVNYEIGIADDYEDDPEYQKIPFDFPITDCVKGFSYRYKGAAHIFITEVDEDVDNNVFKTVTQPQTSNWRTVTVKPEDLAQELYWGNEVDWELSKITILKWAINNKVTGINSALTGTLDIDDIHCLDGSPVPTDPNVPGDGDSYKIFAYTDKNADNVETAWGEYISGYIYPKTGTGAPTIANPNDEYGMVVFNEGVAKLAGVNLPTGYPGAMLGIKTNTSNPRNITDCDKISYYYKGNAHWFLVEFDPSICVFDGDPDDNKWGKQIAASTGAWKKEEVDLSLLKISNTWKGAGCADGNANALPITSNLNKATSLVWGFDNDTRGSSSNLNLMIGEVICVAGSTIASVAPDGSINSGFTPIQPSISAVSSLTVVPFARSLQITSQKDATVSLFDIHGKQVFGEKVSAGQSVISFEKQKQGVYYAVVKAGSQKQIVKVVLK
jgi:hypothetical protein